MNRTREPIQQDDEGAYQISDFLKEELTITMDEFSPHGKFEIKYKASRKKEDFLVDRRFLDGNDGGPAMLIYNVDEFLVKGKKGAYVDLRKILGMDLKFETAKFANLEMRAPEQVRQLVALNSVRTDVDTDLPIVCIGSLCEPDASEPIPNLYYDPLVVVEELSWNILIANFLSQRGLPANIDARRSLITDVTNARENLLNLIDSETGNITEAAVKIATFS